MEYVNMSTLDQPLNQSYKNNNKKPSVGVYILRGQIITHAHEHHIDTSLSNFDATIVLIGSAMAPRSDVNPFTEEERIELYRPIGAEANARYEAATGKKRMY